MRGRRQVVEHGRRDLGEHRDEHPRREVEAGNMRCREPQAVKHRVRREPASVVGERCEVLFVELNAEVVAQQARQRGVHEGLALQLQLEVASATTDHQRPQQHRRLHVEWLRRHRGETHGQVHGIDRARGRKLDALRQNGGCGAAGSAQGQVVSDQVRQQRRLSDDELGEAAGVRRRELDACRRGVDEAQQRRAAAHVSELAAPRAPAGFDSVRKGIIGWQRGLVGGHCLVALSHWLVLAVLVVFRMHAPRLYAHVRSGRSARRVRAN